MNTLRDNFIQALFEPDESVCVSERPFGTAVILVFDVKQDNSLNFISINPLHTQRLDINVTCYRNILLEIDDMNKTDQRELLKNIPWTTLVWSGSKSYHAIISLNEPCESRGEYDSLVKRIYSKVPQVDPANKNPSRFSRLPDSINNKTGNFQELVEVKNRVTKAGLETWLGPQIAYNSKPDTYEIKKGLSPFTQAFLHNGAVEGRWNQTLFMSVCDMLRCGFTLEHTITLCQNITGTLDKRDLTTIQSAYRSIIRDT